ncbi:HIT domain-containing protein [Angustibacter aerolatus]|uniref:Histidine triad nucleotide-binding protein n=1 Tax=Angustibacter aerolatus TaxID=1162965 RepID=A0ABQ6JBU5_9ACTN|nr:HIT domain-containing protein [Angustibacter aerolatus]GMA85632.1 histidine triad nucleotide-binding protein [Angustibacter aerolatus]
MTLSPPEGAADRSTEGPRDPDCLFCRIVSGDVPAEVVGQDEQAVAFRDLDPQAPLHVLVVPRAHHRDVAALSVADPDALGAVVRLGARIAQDEAQGDFRLVFNNGASAHQSVFHVHGHVLGGRDLTWPPG